jgi:hypothetical protein
MSGGTIDLGPMILWGLGLFAVFVFVAAVIIRLVFWRSR